MGKPTVWAFGLGVGAIVILASEKPPHPAAAPKPVTRTVYVHQTVTRVVSHVTHSGLPGWGMVVIAVVALGILCSLMWQRTES